MKRRVASISAAVIGLFVVGAASASAASFTITATPAVVPAGGGLIMLTEAGSTDRPGSYGVYQQSVDQACLPTGEGERNSGKQAINNRQNLAARENFSDPASFQAAAGTSYRLCGYLGDFNDQTTPDVVAVTLVCAAGNHVVSNTCVADSPPPVTGGGGGGGGTIRVTTGAGQCDNVGKFTSIYVTHVDCADGQSIESRWAGASSCKLRGSHATTRCHVLGFTCKARRRHPHGASVRCSRPNQAVTFRFKG